MCTVYSSDISDSCMQNAKQKYCLMFQITVHKVHYKTLIKQ